ncbi:Snf1 kinase complex beta-subunit Gal83 [Penicillium ucsense]|uniref:Snf1 kinase complex beta-subunit Gal83 n=1 Tax=Penicillium ucsense TaxID=2839758 RepID=A0A8J8WGW2_9EURO|nr:Snf1 kinase complex beta-subunit Gal83 [Penicillium ucsense]KAF7732429.1 Snf1 kinase complex beta-subunit Gal83 [Penicillium ucsense]
MGNNPSKGPSGDGPDGHFHHGAAERKVARRTSLNAIRHQKATAADPSATRETAAGHSANYQGSPSHRRHSRNPPQSPNRSTSKPSRQDAKRQEYAPSKGAIPADYSNPVQVPSARQGAGRDPVAPSGPPLSSYYSASQHLQRPPRMPLPIGDATTTPGSPISGPEDSHIQSMPADQLLKEQMEQGVSNLSSATLDGEEIVDELQTYASSGVGKAVPTYIEWSGPGQKVYVTGTFVNWEKKFKLHRGEGEGATMSTTLNLRPGTHHLKFIVDGEMRASDTLPTAVDFTNHLVNYIEISADDRFDSITPGIQASQTVSDNVKDGNNDESTDEPQNKEIEEEVPPGNFGRAIPQFLADLDKEEESTAYIQAANVISDTPTPPSLPLFLGKSILNSNTPTKDDSSVLNYPNHTVLNHLATSSIKNGVLATSVTTRYKRKYVTSILYKPTGDITG